MRFPMTVRSFLLLAGASVCMLGGLAPVADAKPAEKTFLESNFRSKTAVEIDADPLNVSSEEMPSGAVSAEMTEITEADGTTQRRNCHGQYV